MGTPVRKEGLNEMSDRGLLEDGRDETGNVG